jgi:hypothetical protein
MRELILFEIREMILNPDGSANYRFKGTAYDKAVGQIDSLSDADLLIFFKNVCRRSFAQH